MIWLNYNPVTGEIINTGTAQNNSNAEQFEHLGDVIVGLHADRSLHYIRKGKVVDRPIMPIIKNNLKLSGIPLGCAIYIDDTLSVESNRKETITIEKEHESDTYNLRFALFPYLDFEVTV